MAVPLIGLLDDALVHLIPQPVFDFDNRPGAGSNNAWWKGDGGQVGWFIWGYESLWLPASLLENDSQQRLADALFASSRYSGFELHFNKGLAGAPPDAITAGEGYGNESRRADRLRSGDRGRRPGTRISGNSRA